MTRRPTTPEEWQFAVDASLASLILVATGDDKFVLDIEADVPTCRKLLLEGLDLGYVPGTSAIETFIQEHLRIGSN